MNNSCRLNSIVLILLTLCTPLLVSAATMNDLPMVTLVFDEEPGNTAPKRFRTCHTPFNQTANFPTKAGLDNLNISGSAQFSKNSLDKVLNQMNGAIWIIDLRKESHGFLNGAPISWYGQKNQTNIEESDDNIQRQEEMLFKDIGRQRSIIVSTILEKEEGTIQSTQESNVKVQNATTESTLLGPTKLRYLRLGVIDHFAPLDKTVDAFLDFYKTLPPDAWLHFHCRGGVGRSTVFMVMTDILKNAQTVPLKDIIARQALIGGKDLFDLTEKAEDEWKKSAHLARKDFILQFYDYVKDPKGYNSMSWEAWKLAHPKV